MELSEIRGRLFFIMVLLVLSGINSCQRHNEIKGLLENIEFNTRIKNAN